MAFRFFISFIYLASLSPALSLAMEPRYGKPLAFILAGDSTTAEQSSGAGGWGTGFLGTLRGPSYGVNKGHPGATTVSFVRDGDWEECLELTKNATRSYETYVIIQFGHNDQKPVVAITMDEFKNNLEKMAADIQQLGAHPLIFTSLTRRNFNDTELMDDLSDVVPATREAAATVGVDLIDLNAASRKYAQAIGSANADRYSLNEGDRTHLNDHGSVVFGRMVADLLLDYDSHFARWIQSNAKLSNLIAEGKYA